jgi:hypothetical protein
VLEGLRALDELTNTVAEFQWSGACRNWNGEIGADEVDFLALS